MIAFDNVSVLFRRSRRAAIKALDAVSFTVEPGEFFVLLGENGAGKSTAMSCMLGLLRPTNGLVLLMGSRPDLGGDVYRGVGYLPEEPHHYPSYLTIEEALDYYAKLYRRTPSQKQKLDLLERLELAEFRDLRIGKCSKGMKQKVGIAQCLIGEPRILFLDEPMRGLDPVGVREFRRILVEMNRAGATVVMSTHILSEVEHLATTIAILRRGRLAAHDRLENLRRRDERCEVSFEGPPPDYLTEVEYQADGVHAILPVERTADFFALAAAGRLRLHQFSERRPSLEETFLSVIGREETRV
jgi:ABC-type multidrug transport system ATPase subunit